MKSATLWVIFEILFFTTMASAQPTGGGCGSSVPLHYFHQQRTPHPERLTLLFNEDLILCVESKEILEIPSTIDSAIGIMQRHLSRWKDSLMTLPPPQLIIFHQETGKRIRITVMPDTLAPFETVYQPKLDTYHTTRHSFTVIYPLDKDHTLVLYMNRWEDLWDPALQNIDTLIRQTVEHTTSLKISKFIAKNCTYHIMEGIPDFAGAHIHQQGDRSIQITLNPGLSYLNGTFAPSIAFPVRFVRLHKRGHTIIYGLAFDILFHMDPERPYHIFNNWYADAEIEFTRSHTSIFAGYLIHREGDLLPPNAFRLGLDTRLYKTRNISMRAAYHFSLSQPSQNIFELGIHLGW